MLVEHQLLRNSKRLQTRFHASAMIISVAICEADGVLSISVCDDGCGFELEKVDVSGHFGVRGMYERANRLGALLEVNSRISEGTCVNLKLPLSDGILRGNAGEKG